MKDRYKIAVLSGDGIGPEVMEQTLRVLDVMGRKIGTLFECSEAAVGGAAFERSGSHLPEETVALCSSSDAVLFGSVGGPIGESSLPQWKNCEINSILAIRKRFEFSLNVRPVRILPALSAQSPLKESIIEQGVDILFVRELLGDVYFGDHVQSGVQPNRFASDSGTYTEALCRQAMHCAFQVARKRKKSVTMVHKANVLSMSKLWVEVAREVAPEYSDCTFREMLVDNCAMQLVLNPAQFDVVVTSNLFGDILSDLGAALPGTLGLSPSASLNSEGFGLYEPAGGSAPDLAGKGIANPSAQILSAAMMFEYSFGLTEAARFLSNAVESTFAKGLRTSDLKGNATTKEFTDAIIEFCRTQEFPKRK